jgi:hypothetical protein
MGTDLNLDNLLGDENRFFDKLPPPPGIIMHPPSFLHSSELAIATYPA